MDFLMWYYRLDAAWMKYNIDEFRREVVSRTDALIEYRPQQAESLSSHPTRNPTAHIS